MCGLGVRVGGGGGINYGVQSLTNIYKCLRIGSFHVN